MVNSFVCHIILCEQAAGNDSVLPNGHTNQHYVPVRGTKLITWHIITLKRCFAKYLVSSK